MNKIKVEYIWIDGKQPTANLRSKTKIINHPVTKLEDIPVWTFDGSSTKQAQGNFSDCILKPVYYIPDPVRGGENILALCEVYNPDGAIHQSNTRARLRETAEKYKDQEALFGIEQEYTFFKGNQPLGWPDKGFPAPQGGYYCGVGADEVFGRDIVEDHLSSCLSVGLSISGVNAEVMPAQWEFQVGPLAPLDVADQLWLGRWLLYRIAENYRVSATLYPKPIKGDWNGAGAHTNFSIKSMREPGGMEIIKQACEKLAKKHKEHMAVYGAYNEERLTGLHETCSINEFRYGIGDRGSSVRIPTPVANKGYGYLEDRRPAANCDPYQVCAIILETVCSK